MFHKPHRSLTSGIEFYWHTVQESKLSSNLFYKHFVVT